MKPSLLLAIVLAATAASGFSQTPGAAPKREGTLFERFFGPRPPASRPSAPAAAVAPERPWELYRRGELPTGPALTTTEASGLPVGVYADKASYLVGEFVVTAAIAGRAVLRPVGGPAAIRVVVESLPKEAVKPEGALVILDATCGLLIRQITRNADNQLTVFTREITQQ